MAVRIKSNGTDFDEKFHDFDERWKEPLAFCPVVLDDLKDN